MMNRLPSSPYRPYQALLVGLLLVPISCLFRSSSLASDLPSVSFEGAFWDHWGDGQAELCGYEATYSRYGQLRKGTTVTIFVTETFSDEARVKADPGQHPREDEFPVMKLNLVQDFPTGIYEYRVMTSAFMALTSRNGRAEGFPTKISFSAQEWCGHAYQQWLFDQNAIRDELHSYFDGEADHNKTLDYPDHGIASDSLWHWARGLASPKVEPGESIEVSHLPSLTDCRFKHRAPTWSKATLSRSETTETIKVPAGSFDVRRCSLRPSRSTEPSRTFFVESAFPHRIIKWESSTGEQGSLLGSDRMKYWAMNSPQYRESLKRIGLTPR